MNDKKILVTGPTGFVGANFLHRLINSNNDIHIILRETSNIWRISDIVDRINKHYCDLTDRKNTEKMILEI